MAWLSNLAERAEDLLNRLDHNASIVLLQNETKDDFSTVNDNTPDFPVGLILNSSGSNVSSDLETSNGDTTNSHSLITEPLVTSSHVNIQIPVTSTSDVQTHSDTAVESDESNHAPETGDASEVVKDLQKKIEELEAKYTKSKNEIAQLKTLLTDYEGKNSILKTRLKQTITSLSLTQEEMEKHRSKAQKILEDKERLLAQIESMQNSSSDPSEHIEYVSKLIKTRDDQQKTINELNEKIELIQSDLAATQKQSSLFKEEAVAARQTLEKEEKFRLTLEDELTLTKQELDKVYAELKQNVHVLSAKNDELLHLQKQNETRSTSSENEELESKFHVLTQTLIMKQNSLETLTTERNALRLQLERVESDYSKALSELNSKQASSVLNIDTLDEGKSSIFAMSPFDEGVTRRVKRAISTLNMFSIRLGVFLRRYPVARVFLLCYMILLQIWVVVILFAYVPSSY